MCGILIANFQLIFSKKVQDFLLKRAISPMGALLTSQFLSAFVDNTLLFIAEAIILRDHYPACYLPLVQGMYLAAYIVASPWVGGISDYFPKSRVMFAANLLKALCLVGFLTGINPAVSYTFFGLGSVLYSPAKYGILPFLAEDETKLLRANSWMESTTIVAILAGSVAGGFLSDYSIVGASLLGLGLYAVSTAGTLLIPINCSRGHLPGWNVLREFWADIKFFMVMWTPDFRLLLRRFSGLCPIFCVWPCLSGPRGHWAWWVISRSACSWRSSGLESGLVRWLRHDAFRSKPIDASSGLDC